MFRELMSLSYRRTALQALGWYLIFLLFGVTLGGLATVIFSPVAILGANVVSFILLATALLRARCRSALNVFLAFAAVLLGVVLGPPGGLIPLAVLTTRVREKAPKEVASVFE
jgi:hypothetical protein